MNKQIHVFYACDANFAKYTMVSMASLIENASKRYQYCLHILCTDISEEYKATFATFESENVKITFDDVSSRIEKLASLLPVRDYYTKTTYFRFFIPEMYPEIDKAVYIDSDTVVVGDISQMYNIPLMKWLVGACVEQVMAQVPVFGDYAEKVLGVSRYKYFNAGVLLLNCKQMRKDRVFEQFCGLIPKYRFIVAQDQDYLNIICRGKVRHLHPGWNMETIMRPLCRNDEIKIYHYIMVGKPWHYSDVPHEGPFWKYAKKTPVYDEILKEKENYTDEEKERDSAGAKALTQKAIDEIAKKDNYFNVFLKGTLAPDRVAIQEKIEKYEKEGRFDEDVENDPPSRKLMPDEIEYIRNDSVSKLKTKVAFFSARVFLKNIMRKQKMIIKEIRGIDNFRGLESGAVITCNHFNAFDSFAIQLAYQAAKKRGRKFYRIIREGNYTSFPGFYGFLMRNCDTLPLSSNIKTMQKFSVAVAKLLKEGNYILIYPEQSMWWNYKKPKPLKTGGFGIAARNNVPVLPCFITMKDSDVKGDDGYYVQEYTIHISPPIYPDPEKKYNENVKMMLDTNFDIWKKIYEEEYGIPLVYETEDETKN